MRDKRILEILKKQILNINTVEKSFEDIRNIVNCDNYEELLHILRCIENRGKMKPGTNFNVVLNKDFKSHIDAHQEQNGGRVEGVEFPFDTPIQEEKAITFGSKAVGIKETEGKLDYSEINLKILDLMAERFNANKDKYPKGNMKKPLNENSLVWAAFRHIRKMLQPIKGDPETYKEHLAAVLCNMSMILDQETFEND